MPSSTADSSKTSFDTSWNTFLRPSNVVVERDWYHLLMTVIGTAVCISVAMASIVTTPFLKPTEYGLIGWADHLTLARTNRSMTFKNAGSREMGRCVCLCLGSV